MEMSPLALVRAQALLRADARNVARDPVLMVGIVMSIAPALLLAVFGPTAESAGQAAFGFAGTGRILGVVAVLLPGGMLGWVTGFLLLEDRDEAVLTAIEMTPLGKAGFIAWRLGLCAALVFALSLSTVFAALPGSGLAVAFGMALLVAGYGTLVALFLVAFAGNKVEGLALTKLANLGLVAPLLALLPSPLRYLAAPLPPFWIGEMAGLAPDALWSPLAFLLGCATAAALGLLLGRLVTRRVG